MGKIEWAMWANEHSVISCGVLFLGGVLAVSSNALEFKHKRWEIAAYALGISFLIFLIEYPRSKRVKGRTLQRRRQYPLTQCVSCLGGLGRNYFFRFVFYLLASIPCLFNLGTILGGISLLISAIIYLRAAIAGEKWIFCEREVAREKTLTRAQPPTAAPPRLNQKQSSDDDDEEEAYENYDMKKTAEEKV